MKFKVFPTASQAKTFANKMNAPNTVSDAIRNGDGFSPVIRLRPDQKFMAARIIERGIVPAELTDESA